MSASAWNIFFFFFISFPKELCFCGFFFRFHRLCKSMYSKQKKILSAIFPTHTIIQYILIEMVHVRYFLFCYYIYFFSLSSRCCYQAQINSIKVIEQKYFLVVVMVVVHCMWFEMSLSFFARYSSSTFIHLSWLYSLVEEYVRVCGAHPFTSMLDLILAIKYLMFVPRCHWMEEDGICGITA